MLFEASFRVDDVFELGDCFGQSTDECFVGFVATTNGSEYIDWLGSRASGGGDAFEFGDRFRQSKDESFVCDWSTSSASGGGACSGSDAGGRVVVTRFRRFRVLAGSVVFGDWRGSFRRLRVFAGSVVSGVGDERGVVSGFDDERKRGVGSVILADRCAAVADIGSVVIFPLTVFFTFFFFLSSFCFPSLGTITNASVVVVCRTVLSSLTRFFYLFSCWRHPTKALLYRLLWREERENARCRIGICWEDWVGLCT